MPNHLTKKHTKFESSLKSSLIQYLQKENKEHGSNSNEGEEPEDTEDIQLGASSV